MQNFILYIFILICSYIIASIPNALWIGKIFVNKDVRNYGSGNVGSTNAARVLGYKYGILTLVLDVLKGFLPTYVCYLLGYASLYVAIVGLITVLAHAYSIFLNFKGGKSVATTIGVFLAIKPSAILILLVVFLIIFIATKYVSLASIISAGLLFLVLILLNVEEVYVFLGLVTGLLVIYRHKSNIINLINKKEDKFGDKPKKN